MVWMVEHCGAEQSPKCSGNNGVEHPGSMFLFPSTNFGCGAIRCEPNPRESSKPARRNTRREEVIWAPDRLYILHCFLGRTPDSAAHILKLSTWKNPGDVMNLHRGTNSCDIPAGIDFPDIVDAQYPLKMKLHTTSRPAFQLDASQRANSCDISAGWSIVDVEKSMGT